MRREAFARTTARAGIVVPERRQRREKRPGEGGLPPPAVSGLPGEYRREGSRGAGRKTRRYGTPQKTGTSHDAPAT